MLFAIAGVPLLLSTISPSAAIAQQAVAKKIRHEAADAPEQRWGSAADVPVGEGQKQNTTVPQSRRGRYPLQTFEDASVTTANTAKVVEAAGAEPVEGFDPQTSVELPEQRSASEKVYQNADGTQTTEFSSGVANFQTGDGSWESVDTTLEKQGSQLAAAADPVGTTFAASANAQALASVTIDDEHALSYGLRGAKTSAGVTNGSEVTYADVLEDVDLKLAATGTGAKETLVLKSSSAPTSYAFDLDLKGLTAQLDDGAVVLTDAQGGERARIPAGYMVDAGTSARGPTQSDAVTYALDGSVLTVTIDEKWLADPDRAFPVMVDPSVAVKLPVRDSPGDSSMTVRGSSSSANTQEMTVGYLDGSNSAAYVKFNDMVSALQDHTIYGVQLSLVGYDAPSCKARPLNVYAVDQSWSAGPGYSYPGPSTGAKLGSKSFAYGYIAQGKTSSACPATKATTYDLGDAGNKLVQGWADGKANNGISLRAAAGDSSAWKRIAGIGTANAPRLYVTHSPYDASYKITNAVPKPTVLQNQDGKVSVQVTNTGSETWTPSTYYLGYRVYDADGKLVSQVKAASLSGNVAHGAKATVSATIKALPQGQYFLDFSMVKSSGKTPVWFTDYQVAPVRINLAVYNVPPVVKQLYPDNGYESPTLAPQLWAQAMDVDAASSALTYKFQVCEVPDEGQTAPACAVRDYSSKVSWTLPSGTLAWSKHYTWQAWVKDANGSVTTEGKADLFTTVPQPAVSANVSGSANADASLDVDPQVGNYTTSSMDAPVVTTGPALNVLRTYNSLDPRRTGMFGAGWTTVYDMQVVPDDDGSGNVVVTYSDGRQVRFGRNADGTYAAPTGRIAALTQNASTKAWLLSDRGGAKYAFNAEGRLVSVSDSFGRYLEMSYDSAGHLTQAQSVPNTSVEGTERTLTFTWSGSHVASVSTDPVDGKPLTWTYTYTGDLLAKACAPGEVCTSYTYADGSHYRTAVLEDRPDSYYRLGETDGDPDVGSEIAVNLGKDSGTYNAPTLDTAGAIAGSPDTAVTLNGTSSSVALPKGSVRRSVNQAVELWFKTTSNGPLLGYQDKDLTATSTLGVPTLYVGTDGKLRGQFSTGSIAPITTSGTVNDGQWHHAVLSASGNVTTLYLDSSKVGTLSAAITQDTLSGNQVGAAYATTPASWPSWGSAARKYFSGSVDEVAIYDHPLGSAAVKSHYGFGKIAASSLTRIVLPNGATGVDVAYDVSSDRVSRYTDTHGGVWTVGKPLVYGDENDLRRSVQVRNAYGAPYLYEYDALTGQVLRTGMPTGLAMSEQYEPVPAPAPTGDEDEEGNCTQPIPGGPVFCVLVPGDPNGPVFYTLDGLSVRSYEYNDAGQQSRITDENGNITEMGYDARGNVTSTKTCQTSNTDCHTEYSTYPTTVTNQFDPRNDLVTATRDGRSSGPDDNTYRTTYTYAAGGNLATQTSPDGGVVKNTYSTGGQVSTDKGTVPVGLPMTSTDPLGAVTKFGYNSFGDLTQVTEPSGLVTKYAYDVLGRKASETEISDAYPGGVTTTFGYDALSRMTSMTEPVMTDAVSGVKHQRRTGYAYDGNGNAVATRVEDLQGNDEPRQTLFEYDEHGNILRTEDAVGNEISYEYDLLGNRTSVVDAKGRRYEYGYTARSAIAQVRLWDWQGDPDQAPDTGEYLILHNYTYDLGGRLLTDTDAMGRTLEYAYNRDNSLNTLTLKDFHNADGSKRDVVITSNTYDGAGNVLTEASSDGKDVTKYTYTATGQVATEVENPSGVMRRTAYTYDLAGNVKKTVSTGSTSNSLQPSLGLSQTVTFDYDTAGRQVAQSVVDNNASAAPSRTSTYKYDQRGLVVAQTDPRGNVAGASAADFTSTYEYDQMSRRVSSTAPAVSTENVGGAAASVKSKVLTGYNTYDDEVASRDPLGNIATATVDRLGRVVKQTGTPYKAPGSSTSVTPSSTVEYDEAGNVVKATDARGAYTTYVYDKLDRLITQSQPTSDNDTRAVWHYTYNRVGEVLSVRDPRGGEVQSTYDDLDRAITSTQVERYPYADNYTTKFAYDDSGRLTSTTSPTGAVATNTYDTLGQLTTTTDPNGVKTQYGYDEQGNTIRVTDGLGRTTQNTYDGFGQLAQESDVNAAGKILRTQSYSYDAAGNLLQALSPLGTKRTYTYDALGQLTKQTEPTSDAHTITTSFGYDANGNRTRYTDGRGNDFTYTFNSLGLAESAVEPSTKAYPNAADRTWAVSYDVNGNPVKLVAPGGVTRNRTFDAAGRMTKETGTGAEVTTADHTYGYDQLGQVTSVNAASGTNTFAYDDRGGLITATGGSGSASFAYDGDGNVTSRVDGAGTATFTYDKGRLVQEKDGLKASTTNLEYDASGSVKKVDYGYGRVRSYEYDDRGRTTSDTLKNSAGETVSSITYGYDVDDRMISKKTTGTAGAAANTYGYDDAGRLTKWSEGSESTDYAWDDSGNRVKAGDKTSTFNERNQVQSDGDYTYSYAANGTLSGRTSSGYTEKFTFDAFERLINQDGTSYSYDGLDRIASRGGNTFTYAGASDGVVSDGTETYARGAYDELLAIQNGSTTSLSLQDQHGDLVANFAASNTTLSSLDDSKAYDPWGQETASSGAGHHLGYQGSWTDPDTDEVNMGDRWYNSATGSFDSRDPQTYAGGASILANGYTYAAGDPMDLSDPDGNWPSCGWCSKAASAVSSAVTSAAKTVGSAVRTAASYTWKAVTYVASKAVSAVKTAAKYVAKAAAKIYNTGKAAISYVVNKVSQSASYIKQKAAAAAAYAKQRAEAAKKAAIAHAKAVTKKAKAAAAQVIKHNPLPAVKALMKPVLTGMKKVVSATAKLPAAVVQATKVVVQDVAKATTAVYQNAVASAGVVLDNVSAAASVASEFAQAAAPMVLGIAAGALTTAGCTIASGGVGTPACIVAGFAVGGAVTSALTCAPGRSVVGCAATGAASGAVAGVVTVATGGAGSAVGVMASAGAADGLSDAAGQLLSTGSVDLQQVATSAAVGAGTAGLVRGAGSKLSSGAAQAVETAASSCDLRSRGTNSFVAGTEVLMADGSTKPIEDVVIGDDVMAADPLTGKAASEDVTAVIIGRGEKDLTTVQVLTPAGKGTETDTVTATVGHPFWVSNDDDLAAAKAPRTGLGRWASADHLKAGDHLTSAAPRDGPVTVVGSEGTTRIETVYNLTVDSLHTYYVLVGTAAVLVHNCGGSGLDLDGLQDRADTLHTFIKGQGNRRSTTGVIHLGGGGAESLDVVAVGARRNISQLQVAQLLPHELGISRTGRNAAGKFPHAEVKLWEAAQHLELAPSGIAVSRPICPACQKFLQGKGATIVDDTLATWTP
ncbi:RHS repeat-associated core domain-containing protein [Kineosporia succinea]|uniref:RHS repeat-associated protein n=1 Tax=Kineosporia succinea TaxID=84632 RepID=A0ABT9PBV5_9ACTN|nr:RHS repeat-associated core domain-containing protein [Kineosporia succinea]MDP9830181.1 RHS repeat-associated protein [Kineosporia succinea]